jgi:Tfp pilus assembly protein PilN
VRPINLIPPEQRRGENSPLRTGPLPYVLVGALVLVFAGVTALVLTSNQISERRDEIATLKREDAAATARAQRLAAYTQFQAMSAQRVATVTSLADSRFDWERVMRELALVLPSDVWLVSLDATATASASVEGGGGTELRGSAKGPALAIEGCARGQEGVAGFVTALRDIDGVTRVGVESSELASDSGEAGSGGGGGDDCRTRSFIAKFSIVAAFDAAPIPLVGSEESAPAPTPEEASPSGEAQAASDETSESAGEG